MNLFTSWKEATEAHQRLVENGLKFQEFPKVARLNREVIVTEKIDGMNAQIWISNDCTAILAASREGFIEPQDDSLGFAQWVHDHKEDLFKLGPGNHSGEWWGDKIGRRYGMRSGERKFSLFNTKRWTNRNSRPVCCEIVPVLWTGLFCDLRVDDILASLAENGSYAAPGFMRPEGVVIYHTAGDHMYKKTLDKNDDSKWKSEGK